MSINLTPQVIDNVVSILGKFKDLKRSGWLRRQVSDPESVADHSFAVTILSLLLAPAELNRSHCLELAITHDLQEIYAGDMLPGQQTMEYKYHKEREAAAQIAQELDFPQFLEWFEEFEAQLTAESRFVKAIDKLESAVSAVYYHQNHRNGKPILPEFTTNAARWISQINTSAGDDCQKIIAYLEGEYDGKSN